MKCVLAILGGPRLRRGAGESDFDHAATLIEQFDDIELHVLGLNDRGYLSLGQGQFEEAIRLLSLALPLTHGVDTGRWEAVVEGNLSVAYAGLGNGQAALEHADPDATSRATALPIQPLPTRRGLPRLGDTARVLSNAA